MTSRGHPRPVIHGRDHKGPDAAGNPGGVDPSHLNVDATDTVGLLQGVRSAGVGVNGYVLTSLAEGGSIWLPGFPSTGATPYADAILLLGCHPSGYWRLGEASAPFADSNPDLSSIALTVVSGTNPITPDVTGALDGAQDDGAVMFNGWGNTAISGGVSGQYLTLTSSRFDFGAIGSTYSVSAWVKPLAHSPTGYYSFAGIVQSMSIGALSEKGWAVEYDYTTHVIRFRRIQDGSFSIPVVSGTVPLDSWSHFVAQYDGSHVVLYINGALAATTTGSTGTASAGSIEVGRNTTYSPAGGAGHNYFYGVIDELAIFPCVLSADDVLALYNAGLNEFLSGDVLTVQPDGTFDWSAPTYEVTYD